MNLGFRSKRDEAVAIAVGFLGSELGPMIHLGTLPYRPSDLTLTVT